MFIEIIQHVINAHVLQHCRLATHHRGYVFAHGGDQFQVNAIRESGKYVSRLWDQPYSVQDSIPVDNLGDNGRGVVGPFLFHHRMLILVGQRQDVIDIVTQRLVVLCSLFPVLTT